MSKEEAFIPEFYFSHKENWVEKPISELFERVKRKNKELNKNVLTISAEQGLISQIEYFNKRIASRDTSNYYLLKKGEFAYNKSYSNGYPVGVVRRLNRYDKGVVSTLYICFKAKEDTIPDFFEYYFDTKLFEKEIHKIAQEGGRNHGLLNVGVVDFFSSIKFYVPNDNIEQQKIAACLSSLDELIAAEQDKLAALQRHKKGLLQNLFPKEGEKVPAYRFPEFRDNGEWVEKRLGDPNVSDLISDKISTLSLNNSNYVSTNNMLSDYAGITDSSKVPNSSRVNRFVVNDVLVSNIRPYLKKVWKADKSGGASNDILIFRAGREIHPNLLEHVLKNDRFIQYMMKGAKGLKMPRGDKDSIESYKFHTPTDETEQLKIAHFLTNSDLLIFNQLKKITEFESLKKGLIQVLFPN